MKTKVTTLICLLMGLLVLGMAGCSSVNQKSAANKTLVVCTTASPYGFDMAQYIDGASIGASGPIYNQLLGFKAGSSDLKANLATRWKVSSDGLTYTFYLRQGVKFHTTDYFKPTRDFNADDVIFTFERMRNPKHPFNIAYPAEFPYFFAMGMDKNIRDIKKVDDYTVQFVLKKPYAPFIQNMAMEFTSIYSSEYAGQLLRQGKAAQIASKPIGTGPFILKNYRRDQQISYVANKQYWDKTDEGSVQLDAVLRPIIREMAIHAKKMKAGECHLGSPPFSEIAAFKKDPNFVVKEYPGFLVGFISYNTQKPALRKKAVRQALDMALNKEALIKVYRGTAKVATSIMPPNQWSFDPSLKNAPYNPVKAKQLLKKAGYPNGFSLKFFVSFGVSPENQSLAEMIQSDWEKIGVKVKFVSYEAGEFWKHVKNGEHDALLSWWQGDNGDPDNWVDSLLGCNSIKQGSNHSRWCYKPMQALIIKGQRTTNKEARIKIYQEAQKLFMQELPMSPFQCGISTSIRSKKIKVLSKHPPATRFVLGVAQFTGITLEE